MCNVERGCDRRRGRRSDDAVRRLREESRHRVERERRGRAFFSWCALTTLASGFALAALDATPDDIDPPPPPAPVVETVRGPAADPFEAAARRLEEAACFRVEVAKRDGGFRNHTRCPGGVAPRPRGSHF